MSYGLLDLVVDVVGGIIKGVSSIAKGEPITIVNDMNNITDKMSGSYNETLEKINRYKTRFRNSGTSIDQLRDRIQNSTIHEERLAAGQLLKEMKEKE